MKARPFNDLDRLTFVARRRGLLDAAFQALVELEANGRFGPRTATRYVVLWVVDSDEPVMAHSAAALNGHQVFRGYCSAHATDA